MPVRTYRAEPATERRYAFGEGVRWHAAEQRLLWVDLSAGRLHRAPLDALDEPETVEVGEPLGAVAPVAAGGLLLAAGQGLAHLSDDGALTRLTRLEPPYARMNDAACDPAGRFWAGSTTYDERPGAGALHRLDLDGEVRTALRGLTISNGPAWSPDGTTLYLDDSGRQVLLAYDVDADGRLSGERELVRFDEGAGDGLVVDDDGHLWVAVFGGSAVHRYDPAGRLVATVPLPASQVSSCCLAEGRLLATTVSEGLDEPEAAAGRLFVTDVGVDGPPVHPFRGRLPPPA